MEMGGIERERDAQEVQLVLESHFPAPAVPPGHPFLVQSHP